FLLFLVLVIVVSWSSEACVLIWRHIETTKYVRRAGEAERSAARCAHAHRRARAGPASPAAGAAGSRRGASSPRRRSRGGAAPRTGPLAAPLPARGASRSPSSFR